MKMITSASADTNPPYGVGVHTPRGGTTAVCLRPTFLESPRRADVKF